MLSQPIDANQGKEMIDESFEKLFAQLENVNPEKTSEIQNEFLEKIMIIISRLPDTQTTTTKKIILNSEHIKNLHTLKCDIALEGLAQVPILSVNPLQEFRATLTTRPKPVILNFQQKASTDLGIIHLVQNQERNKLEEYLAEHEKHWSGNWYDITSKPDSAGKTALHY